MSKKDYQTIAACLYMTKQPGSPYHNPNVYHVPHTFEGAATAYRAGFDAAISLVTRALALKLELENPRFDHGRFFEACETGKTRGMKQVA